MFFPGQLHGPYFERKRRRFSKNRSNWTRGQLDDSLNLSKTVAVTDQRGRTIGNSIGVPTAKGLGDAFKDFGIGAAGGAVAAIAMRLFGGLGLLAAPLLAGSVIKGDRGTIIATGCGALVGMLLLGGLGGTSSTSSTSQQVM